MLPCADGRSFILTYLYKVHPKRPPNSTEMPPSDVHTMMPAKNLINMIHRKDMMQAATMATPIIHHVSLRSLKTRSPRPRSWRNAPSAVTALDIVPSLTGLPSIVWPSPNTVLLGLDSSSLLTTRGKQRPRTGLEGNHQDGQISFFIRSIAEVLSHSESGTLRQYGFILLLIMESPSEDAYAAAYPLYWSLGHSWTQTWGVGQPRDKTAGLRQRVRSKKSRNGRSSRSPMPQIWPCESVG